LVTEPLDEAHMSSIGWGGRQGLADAANQFHYYRLTDDNRILWGGYDAIYHYGNAVAPELEQRPETFELLASQLAETFPQLGGVPAAGGRRLKPPVGGRDRHVQPLLRHVRHDDERPRVLRRRVHRTWGGSQPVRRPGRARPGRPPRHGGNSPSLRAQQAAAVSTRAAALRRHPPDDSRARARRPQQRPPQPLPAHARPARARVRQLDTLPSTDGRRCGAYQAG